MSQAHEALQAAHEALQAEAQRQSDTAAEQRREAAARDEVKDAEEVAAVAELHSRMGELQVQCFAFPQPSLILREAVNNAACFHPSLYSKHRNTCT